MKSSAIAELLLPCRRFNREISFWLIAVLISILLHALFFWSRSEISLPPATVKDTLRITRINFHKVTPQPALSAPLAPTPPKPKPVRKTVIPHPQPVVMPAPKKLKPVRKKVIPRPQPVVMPTPKKLEPRPEPIEVKPPTNEIVSVENEPAPPKVIIEKTIEEAAVVEIPAVVHVAAPVRSLARKMYLHKLLAHIEAHKYYPAVARRRRLEGEVRVSFTIAKDGSFRDLQVSDGAKVLQDAGMKSVQRSLPLPVPDPEIPMPLTISFNMQFRLR